MLAVRPAPRSNIELFLAFLANASIGGLYLLVVSIWEEVPQASGLFGHSLGIIGFLLMLSTETLYSLRKRSLSARWGRLSTWLRVHIFTGLVGSFMVLLHTSWKFNGLAGLLTLFTVIIVLSGFIGRYIYTAIPRSASGAELEAEMLGRYLAEIELSLQSSAPVNDREQRRLKKRRDELRRQSQALARTRRLLALWHTIHVPIGMVLFTTALIHIIAAVYYATLPRLMDLF